MTQEPEDQFVQRRLLLACVISALVITAYFMAGGGFPPAVAPQPDAAPSETTAAPQPSQANGEEPADLPEPTVADSPEAILPTAADEEKTILVSSENYQVEISNRGAVVTSWRLLKYNDAQREPLELARPSEKREQMPLALSQPGGAPFPQLNDALFTVSESGNHLTAPTTLTFEYSSGVLAARKTFRFESEGYTVGIETEVRENGVPQEHMLGWRGGFADLAQPQVSTYSNTFYFDRALLSIERHSGSDAEEDQITDTGNFSFAGIEDLFFTATFLPQQNDELRVETSAVELAVGEGEDQEIFAAIAVGGGVKNHFDLLVGPKSVELLSSVRPELRQIVDFGFLSFLAEPLFWMLRWTHDNVVANYGWSIILITLAINLVLFPLKWKSTKSMKKMQALQPLVKQIQEKYKGLGMRDPKKAQQNEEMMALYKKHGVNPVGGCLPMLLQMPFLIGFYNVLTVAVEMRQAAWLWVPDLSVHEDLPIHILPIAMMATQFWAQSITPQPTTDMAQMKMMKFMPLMFGFIFYSMSSGLVLYWLTSNLIGVAQQYLLNLFPAEEIEIEQPRRRKRKKK